MQRKESENQLGHKLGLECQKILVRKGVCRLRPKTRIGVTQKLEGEKAFQANRTTDGGQQCLIRDPEEALYVYKRYRQGRMETRKVGKGPHIIRGTE